VSVEAGGGGEEVVGEGVGDVGVEWGEGAQVGQAVVVGEVGDLEVAELGDEADAEGLEEGLFEGPDGFEGAASVFAGSCCVEEAVSLGLPGGADALCEVELIDEADLVVDAEVPAGGGGGEGPGAGVCDGEGEGAVGLLERGGAAVAGVDPGGVVGLCPAEGDSDGLRGGASREPVLSALLGAPGEDAGGVLGGAEGVEEVCVSRGVEVGARGDEGHEGPAARLWEEVAGVEVVEGVLWV
jgi:hypothetical protein